MVDRRGQVERDEVQKAFEEFHTSGHAAAAPPGTEFTSHGNDLRALLLEGLRDIEFTERAVFTALPNVVMAADAPELRAALERRLRETQSHLDRILHAFSLLGEEVMQSPRDAIQGLLMECREIADDFAGGVAVDAALIGAVQALEHYEIARYGAMVAWARQLGLAGIAETLGETLADEKRTDQALTALATQAANPKAC